LQRKGAGNDVGAQAIMQRMKPQNKNRWVTNKEEDITAASKRLAVITNTHRESQMTAGKQ